MFRRGCLVEMFVAIGVLLVASSGRTAPNDGAVKKSIMLQLSSVGTVYSIDAMVSDLDHLCRHHRDPSKDDHIFNLTLTDVATYSIPYAGQNNQTDSVLKTTALDALRPFVAMGCFDNVFVGTVDIGYYPTADKYWAGILDSAFRWENLYEQRTVAAAFNAWWTTSLGSRPYHWYVSFEANLSYFTNSGIKAAYEAYLLQSVVDLHAVPGRSATAVQWSPTFWTSFAGTSTTDRQSIKNNLASMFTNVALLSNSAGINWLDLQDFVGQTHCPAVQNGYPTTAAYQNAVSWFGLVGQAYNFASRRMNLEYFRSCQLGPEWRFSPMPLSEIRTREDYYEANSIPVGASFDLRYWASMHVEL